MIADALIVSPAGEAAEHIRAWAEGEGLRCDCASDSESAMGLLASREYQLAIINAPIDGEDGSRLALAAARAGAGAILLARRGDGDRLEDILTPEGAAVLERPVSRALFRQALRLMNASRRHVENYRSEVFRLRAQLDETKLIDRAKCVLIQYLGLSEKDAHRYIEKQAMDMRLSKVEIAENILKTYES